MFSNLKNVDPNINLSHVVLIFFYAKHNTPNTIHFIVKLLMSTVYNESCFKINQCVSLMLVFVDFYYNLR